MQEMSKDGNSRETSVLKLSKLSPEWRVLMIFFILLGLYSSRHLDESQDLAPYSALLDGC
jgi:hypothetical protein